jgi:hypothetical protein
MKSRHVRQIAFVVALSSAAVAQAQEARTLPLDPLTPQEHETAMRIAQADARVKELLGDRTRLIYTEFIAVKRSETPGTAARPQAEAPPAGRFADVLFIRYDTNVGVRVLVDLAAKKVSEVVRVSGRSVPINTDEVEQAARLALADERVVRLFGPQANTFRVARSPAGTLQTGENRIEGLRTLGATREDPCYEHRCIVLFFRQANRYIRLNQVVVDLTTQRVLLRGGQP